MAQNLNKTKNMIIKLFITSTKRVQATENVIYASDTDDAKHGTMVLPGADFNTNAGHCRKTEAILVSSYSTYNFYGDFSKKLDCFRIDFIFGKVTTSFEVTTVEVRINIEVDLIS